MTPANIKLCFMILAGLIVVLGTGYLLLANEVAGVRREIAETNRRLALARLKTTDLYPKGPNEL